MLTFREFDSYLGQDFSVDYWYDDAKLRAHDFIGRFTHEDWGSLRASWRARPATWQVRCAEVLDWGDPREAQSVLLDMIRADHSDLVVAAAESLESLQREGAGVVLPPAVETSVRARAARSSGPEAFALRSLLVATGLDR